MLGLGTMGALAPGQARGRTQAGNFLSFREDIVQFTPPPLTTPDIPEASPLGLCSHSL